MLKAGSRLSRVVALIARLISRRLNLTAEQLIALVLVQTLLVMPLAAPVPRPFDSASAPGPAAGVSTQDKPAAAAVQVIDTQQPFAAGDISVSVAYADNAQASANFPVPWEGSPNVVFRGGGAPIDAGAIRIDNNTGLPITIGNVTVDLQRPGPQFNLWGTFTIPARGSAVLTQTAAGNFTTNDFPIVNCGGTLPAGDTRVPKITVTVGGLPTTYLDTAHVLDTGGFDLGCRGNQSLQWRPIGSTGIASPAGRIVLTPESSNLSGGASFTGAARVTDAAGLPLANVPVNFKILSGPNAPLSQVAVTDSQGYANMTYATAGQGADVLQASFTNATEASILSNQATVTWSSAGCGSAPPPAPAATSLVYLGPASGQYSDPLPLSALLTDGSGNPLPGRTVTFAFGSQTLTAATDAAGIARTVITPMSVPAPTPLTIRFAGDGTYPAAQTSPTIWIEREDTFIRYTAKTLLGTAVPQPVSALLLDPDSQAPLANKLVTFEVGSVKATATTNASGVASTTLTLTPNETSGPAVMKVSFAGDDYYKPAFRATPVTIYLSTAFVVWGGNVEGLKLGQRVNFWGAQWPLQVIQGDYVAQGDFKGLADPVDQIHICQPTATVSSITTACWSSKAGQSWPPPLTVPAYIEVIVSTVIVKKTGLIYGNIAAAVVVKVDPDPPYGPDPGKPGYGVIVAVIEDTNVFPAPAVLTASQTQPATVLPGQRFDVTVDVSNSGTTAATTARLTENFDGLQPASGSYDYGTISGGQTRRAIFQETVPTVPIRQGNESSVDYQSRLAALSGRLYTSTGTVTFSDPASQLYLPVDVSSFSVLQLPIFSVALSAPATVSPGARVPYLVTVINVGSAVATSGTATLTLPDGSSAAVAIANLEPGASFSSTVNWTAPAIPPKGPSETTAQYLARLKASDGQRLTASANVTWRDALANSYGDVGQPTFTSMVRVPVLSVTPQLPSNVLPRQSVTLNLTVQNAGGCTAELANLRVTNPDGTSGSVGPFVLAGGQSTVLQTTWTVPGPARRGASETDADYQTRLAQLDNSRLDFSINLDWSDPGGAVYGPTTGSASTFEVLPIVAAALSAPATAQSGNTITYNLSAANLGHATAAGVDLALTLPDGSVQRPAVGALAPGATFQMAVNYAIPASQPTGTITARAVVNWSDAGQTGYGHLSASASTSVTNPAPTAFLTLAPIVAGPNPTGAAQVMQATLKDANGAAIAGAVVQFTVTGVNPTTGTATTDTSGVASFSYVGSVKGDDLVRANYNTVVSNTATVSWVTPVQSISTSTIWARFFPNPNFFQGGFNTPPAATPVFTQSFPVINFNPPAGTVPGNTSGVGWDTRPITDVVTDLYGYYTGTIVAQGNGYQAGVGPLGNFQAVFVGTFTVASEGDVVFNFYTDDGFILGVGGGATRVSGAWFGVPPSQRTPFENLPVMGAYNLPTAPRGNQVVVHFPGPGTYPYEVDYSECCLGQLVLTMTSGAVNPHGVPPSGALRLTPITVTAKPAGGQQSFTVLATDASDTALPNRGVALLITGANFLQLNATTDATGRASFTYTGTNPGNDTAQAVASISGMMAFSNVVTVPWTMPAGSTPPPPGTPPPPPGSTSDSPLASPGWIGAPRLGETIMGRAPITASKAVTAAYIDFWPSSNPAELKVLATNVSGGAGATLAWFDATTLANGEYTIRLRASGSETTTSLITVKVAGENKPGRILATATDLMVPVVGLPITIARTYDSLERGKVGDFGYGWKLALGTRLEVNGAKDVTFTLHGRRMTFYFTPQSQGFPFYFLLNVKYTPEAGVFGTLTADGCQVVYNPAPNYNCFSENFGAPYSPTLYTYTDSYGRVYKIGADGALKSIRDLNGNTLTVTANGISSSAGGLTVPFQRDAQARITQITDPQGNAYRYGYDAAGNLVSVTYPGIALPSQYEYDASHLLTKEIDRRGYVAGTSTYYPDGRLQTITDFAGNTTQYAYDVPNRTTTVTNPDGGRIITVSDAYGNPLRVTDPLNRITTYTYDANRNVLTKTDPLGKTWTYTYDTSGNRTSEKDPLGNITTTEYNQHGGPTKVTDPLGNVRTTSYDAYSRPGAITDALGQLAAATYDTAGSLATLTDANGKTGRLTYDAQGNVIGATDALNHSASATYNSLGLRLTLTDSLNNTTRYTYDAGGKLTRTTLPDSSSESIEYDADGNVSARVEALGRRTEYTYDAANRLIQTRFPDGTTTSAAYNWRGQPLTQTDQAGRVTKYEYDLAGQLVKVTNAFGTADASVTRYTYDAAGRKTGDIDPNGRVTTYVYDAAGRMTQVKNALNQATSSAYDAAGRRISVTDPLTRKTQFAYDARGRLTQTSYPDGTTTSSSYDGAGHVIAATDQAGRATRYSFDDVGNLLSVTDALSQVTRYGYDAGGNLLTRSDANGHATAYTYDALNRLKTRTLPGGGAAETHSYNASGTLASVTDFNGKTTTFAYDAMDRLLSRTPDPSFGEPATTFTYTTVGLRASMTDASGTTTYSYDNQNRLLSKTTPFGRLSYTYDVAGNPLSMASSNVNGVSVAYTYDELNRLKTVTSDGRTTTYSYDAAGNLSQTAYPNGVRFTPGRDTMYRVTSFPVTSTPSASYVYTYGPVGNRLTATERSGRTATYGYDSIYRLTSETIASDPGGKNGALSYLLDPVGNRLSLNSTLSGILSQSFTYDANDRIVGNTYDANGNTLVSGARTFAYDSQNRLKSFNSGAVTMTYDGDGNLVGKARGGAATTFYLVDENNPTGLPQVVEEIVGGVVLRVHTHGLERISQRQWLAGAWQTSYYGYDAHGDVRFLTNSAGAVTDTYDYDAWGDAINVTGVTPNAYLYQGEQFDADTRLYYLRARYFDPLTGRFLTTDPEPRSEHLYVYAGADPVNRFDPTGRQPSGSRESPAGLLIFAPIAGGYLAFAPGPLTWAPCRIPSCQLSVELGGPPRHSQDLMKAVGTCGGPTPPTCDQGNIEFGKRELKGLLAGARLTASPVFRKYKDCITPGINNIQVKCLPSNDPDLCGRAAAANLIFITPLGAMGRKGRCGAVACTLLHETLHLCQSDFRYPWEPSYCKREQEAFRITCQVMGCGCDCAKNPKLCGYKC